MRNDLLDDEKGYPWRASLTKVARCFYCQSYNGECAKGRELKYPLVAAEHHCPDYLYRPDRIPIPTNIFATPDFPECTECSKYFQGACSGKSWIPVHIKNGKCEFFRDAGLICKNAVPFLQYGNHIRNNYCKLPPHLRDGNTKGGWKCCCPNAHNEYVKGKKCYRPLVSVHVPDSRPELETDRKSVEA